MYLLKAIIFCIALVLSAALVLMKLERDEEQPRGWIAVDGHYEEA